MRTLGALGLMLWTLLMLGGCGDGKGAAATGTTKASPTPAVTAVVSPTVSPAPSATPTALPIASPTPPGNAGAASSTASTRIFPILYYHAVSDVIEGLAELHVSPSEFDKQMAYLKKNGYTVLTFDELKDARNVEKPAIITFDDGYMDNWTYAYPILQKYGFKATIFLTTEFIDKPNYLGVEQIKEMQKLVNFQGHSLTHPYLTRLSNDEVIREITESKKIIQGITGAKVDVFAYPIGDYNGRVLELVKKEYRYAVLNGGGLYTQGDPDYEIKRVYVPRNLDIEGFEKKISGR